jgi:polysaccharide export outer membrane protein
VSCRHVRAPQEALFEEPKAVEIILGAGDVIDLRIFDEKELSGLYQITAEGFIRLPLVGVVNVAGMNSEEASAYIAAEYQKKYLKNPDVSIFVQQSNSRRVYLLGEVRSPGPYSYEANMTLIGAIAKAGGPTGQAAANRTLISRTQDGKQLRLTARVSDMGQGETPDIPVLPGDIIFVPQSIF